MMGLWCFGGCHGGRSPQEHEIVLADTTLVVSVVTKNVMYGSLHKRRLSRKPWPIQLEVTPGQGNLIAQKHASMSATMQQLNTCVSSDDSLYLQFSAWHFGGVWSFGRRFELVVQLCSVTL